MPSLYRRREEDLRAGRFESEITSVEQHVAVDKVNSRKGLLHCQRCGKSFEEYSRTCPRCDRKDAIGYIKPIPMDLREQAHRRAVERSRRRLGL